MATHEPEQQITQDIRSAADALEPSYYRVPDNVCLELVKGQIERTVNLSLEEKSRLLQRVVALKQAGRAGW